MPCQPCPANLMRSASHRYVTASIYQMLRGAEILFSALFAVLFLKRKLNRLHYGGVVCCMVRTICCPENAASITGATYMDVYLCLGNNCGTYRATQMAPLAGGHLYGGRQQPALQG